jgi:mRNA-degrading endonuclease RelE of RelBE toxin-antitoxin system
VPKKVQKEIDEIPNLYRQKIIATLSGIASDPFCGKKLEGARKGQRSIRVWPYRIIYAIIKEDLVVLVITVGHRQGIY